MSPKEIEDIEDALKKKIITRKNLQVRKSISHLIQQDADSDYPIIKRGADSKFKKSFLDFWQKLITKCPNKILYDDFFMDKLISWLSGLTKYKSVFIFLISALALDLFDTLPQLLVFKL